MRGRSAHFSVLVTTPCLSNISLAHECGHGFHGRRLLQDGNMPLRVGEERARIAGPVVVRERIGVEILVRQQTDAHAIALGPGKGAEST